MISGTLTTSSKCSEKNARSQLMLFSLKSKNLKNLFSFFFFLIQDMNPIIDMYRYSITFFSDTTHESNIFLK